eukprot:CAMPEP_0179848090 /NCGR_PEP_ID=MMETSP0982-20121206/6438_1 /TAXON_ID=483367 /ORGANISM="non described non described, Strain CCMP 2436" /LENGTH=472 /DNA_ID=CAMNT_0021733333 /DNA_START=516 /DNA_END=1936 /DNA_ORIENTATION=-
MGRRGGASRAKGGGSARVERAATAAATPDGARARTPTRMRTALRIALEVLEASSAVEVPPLATGSPLVKPHIRGVIFDLDGVLLDTERLVREVTGEVVRTHFGKTFAPDDFAHCLGRTPRDAVAELIRVLELPCSIEEYLALSGPLLLERWCTASAIPGAARLVEHLARSGVPIAVGTSSDRRTVDAKVAPHAWFAASFGSRVITSSDVRTGKPAPDIFLRACELLGDEIPPSACLVIEDAPAGCQAAKAGQMYAVALLSESVPAPLWEALPSSCRPDQQIQSFYDFDPSEWGLPPFTDTIHGTVPRLPPLRLVGEVVRGFGRGSKELGIPTANLPADAYAELLSSTTCGIYHGFAQLDDGGPIYPMVTSIGRNPYYGNTYKTVEPHILHTFPEDFYGKTMKLLVVGWIRPEANFSTLDALIKAIHNDIEVARAALKDPFYASFVADKVFSVPQSSSDFEHWQASAVFGTRI